MSGRRLLCLFLLFVLPCGGSAEVGPSRLSLVPAFSLQHLNSTFGLNIVTAYGGTLSFAITSKFRVLLSAAVGAADEPFDTPDGVNSLRVHTTEFDLGASYALLDPGVDFSASLRLGFGALRLITDRMPVTLGALGQAVVPAHSDTRSLIVLGAPVALHLGGPVAVQLEPALLMLAPGFLSSTGYSISGGLQIAIL